MKKVYFLTLIGTLVFIADVYIIRAILWLLSQPSSIAIVGLPLLICLIMVNIDVIKRLSKIN
jgi:hypothetical protein